MTDDLVAFLRERLDEDERTARAATPGPWTHLNERGHPHGGGGVFAPEHRPPGYNRGIFINRASYTSDVLDHPANAVHIARHDPARVLAEVAAKRQLLVVCETAKRNADLPDPEGGYPPAVFVNGYASALDHAVRLAALPYADHPDYRPEWAPEA